MGGDPLGEVWECEINIVAVVVPVAIAARVEMARWRGAGKSKPVSCSARSFLALRRDFFRRDRWKNGEAHGLVCAKSG